MQKVVRHGGKASFAEASEDLKEDLGLDLSPKQIQRITERVGREWAQARDAQIELFKQGRLPRLYRGTPGAVAAMVDGGRVLTRGAEQRPGVHDPQWKEPKYGCCLTLDTLPSSTDPRPAPPPTFVDRQHVPKLVAQVKNRTSRTSPERAVVRLRKKKRKTRRVSTLLVRTVVASMCGAETFGYILAMEAYLRNFDRAQRKAFVADGQACNWTIWDRHFREWGFVPVLDFLHLLTYLYDAAQALGGGTEPQWARYTRWLHLAWEGRREALWAELSAASARLGAPRKDASESDPARVVADAARYVENNLSRMDYPRYRKLGLPVSSAPIESTVKQFNRRVKGTEKFWLHDGVEAVLQVRAAQLSRDGRTQRLWAYPRPRYRAVGRNRAALVA